jgi:hypothetical protein
LYETLAVAPGLLNPIPVKSPFSSVTPSVFPDGEKNLNVPTFTVDMSPYTLTFAPEMGVPNGVCTEMTDETEEGSSGMLNCRGPRPKTSEKEPETVLPSGRVPRVILMVTGPAGASGNTTKPELFKPYDTDDRTPSPNHVTTPPVIG